MTKEAGLQLDTLVAVDKEQGAVSVTFDRSLCPLDAIYGAAYGFIDRFYVFLDSPAEGKVRVRLKGRSATTAEALEASAGEFANELITHCWRTRLVEQNRPLVEAIVSQAMAGAIGGAGLTDLGDLDDLAAFDDDVFDDPLGIAESWEDKSARDSARDQDSANPSGEKPPTP